VDIGKERSKFSFWVVGGGSCGLGCCRGGSGVACIVRSNICREVPGKRNWEKSAKKKDDVDAAKVHVKRGKRDKSCPGMRPGEECGKS